MDRLLQLLPERRQTIWVRYAATAAMALSSIAVFSALEMQSGFVGLFVLLPAIFLAGLLFDRGSGFLATVIEVAAVLWIISDPYRLVLPILLFVFMALAFAALAETIRKQLDKVAAAGRAKDLLLRELAHRTKNNLAMLSAIVRLQSKRVQPESRVAFEDTSQRIQVMSEVYDHMTLRNDVKLVDVRDCLLNICQKLSSSVSGPVGIRCESDPLYCPAMPHYPSRLSRTS